MKRQWLLCGLFVPMGVVWAAGCGDDLASSDKDAGSEASAPVPDAGPPPAIVDGAAEAATGLGCGDVTGAPPRLLLSMSGATTSELVAFNLVTHAVDGRLTYQGFGTTSSTGSDPYLLAQQADVVMRLDAREPWKAVSTWSTAGSDRRDGGAAYSDPATVIVPSCGKGYVLRFTRNGIAVIDTTKAADAAPPESFIDLSGLLQAKDPDGLVEMTSAVYVPDQGRMYVLLANYDSTKIAPDGYTALCADTAPTIVGIDVITHQIVSLGGTGPGGSIALGGYNPALGSPLWYDAPGKRLLVLSAGCNLEDADGGAGAVSRRRVEEVDLATGQVKTLLLLDTRGFPASFVYVDATRAALSFYGDGAFFWNPAAATLGAPIPGGLDFLASDGNGNVVGPRATYLADGGTAIEVVSVPFSDAGAIDAAAVTKLGENPFTDNRGFLSGAETWPRR
jgi:hypothetical protein